MPWKRAKNYRIFHTHEGTFAGKTTISIWFENQEGFYKYENLELDRAAFIIDLLRNEDPIWIAESTGLLQVALEPVGDAE
jgi:hypothetical protein